MASPKFAVKPIAPVEAEVEVRLNMPMTLEVIIALREHIANAPESAEPTNVLLSQLEAAYTGDLPNPIGDAISA